MKQFKFIGYLIVMTDIHEVNKAFSVGAQSDEKTIVDLPGMREKYKQSLTALMNGELGSEAKRRLASLKEGKLKMIDALAEDSLGEAELNQDAADVEITEDEHDGSGGGGQGGANSQAH